jgi:hypothetical protein
MDVKVKGLVDVMNKYPGINTSSSCGGHKNPESGQVPFGEWYVNFDIWGEDPDADMPSFDGWKSLGKLSHATFEYIEVGDGRIDLVVCNLSDRDDDPEGLCNYFEVHGYNADIKIFTNILKKHIPKVKSNV